MTRHARLSLSVLTLGIATSAFAGEAVTATFHNFLYGTDLVIIRPHETISPAAGGLMDMSIDDGTGVTSYGGYCVDLDNPLDFDQTYAATLEPLPNAAPWCEVANIIGNNDPSTVADPVEADEYGAAIQAAIWKVLYADEDLSVPPFDDASDAIIADIDDSCPVGCIEDVALDVAIDVEADGNLYADLVLSVDGEAAAGRAVDIIVTGGELVPAGGYAITSVDGVVSVVVTPDGSPDDVTVTFEVAGQDLYLVQPTESLQQVVVIGDSCSYSADATYESTPFGDPRTIGFWKHQTKTALGGNGRNHVDADTLESWLPLTVFDSEFSSIEDMNDALWLKKASMQERAVQQCLATTLNFAWGELGWYSEIDFDADGASDGYFHEFWTDAEGYYDAGDYEAAKDICDGINNL